MRSFLWRTLLYALHAVRTVLWIRGSMRFFHHIRAGFKVPSLTLFAYFIYEYAGFHSIWIRIVHNIYFGRYLKTISCFFCFFKELINMLQYSQTQFQPASKAATLLSVVLTPLGSYTVLWMFKTTFPLGACSLAASEVKVTQLWRSLPC